MKIISIAGLIGSGKDTIADYLINSYNFTRMSYASSLKDAVAAIFHWDRHMLEGSTKESREIREQVDQWWATRLGISNLSPRWVLQNFGTDVCRKAFHDDIWIASLEKSLSEASSDVVISDCRFPNELKSLKNLGATTLRAERGERPYWYYDALSVNVSYIVNESQREVSRQRLSQWGIHPSEYSGVGLEYDHVVENNGTLEDLYSKVDSIINL
jgi:hypothetical protein